MRKGKIERFMLFLLVMAACLSACSIGYKKGLEMGSNVEISEEISEP